MGESIRRKNTRGVYETFTSDIKNKIILKNDNDERRRDFETCTIKGQRVCNPIIDWDDREIWDYIRSEKIPINPLYNYGFSRVGCIGCPLAGKGDRYAESLRWPKYKQAYMRAFEKMLEVRRNNGMETQWKNADEVLHWWMEDGVLPGQVEFDFEDDE